MQVPMMLYLIPPNLAPGGPLTLLSAEVGLFSRCKPGETTEVGGCARTAAESQSL